MVQNVFDLAFMNFLQFFATSLAEKLNHISVHFLFSKVPEEDPAQSSESTQQSATCVQRQKISAPNNDPSNNFVTRKPSLEMVSGRSVAHIVLCAVLSLIPAIMCERNTSDGLHVPHPQPSVTVVFPAHGQIISEAKWTMRIQFSNFEGLSAIVMFGTGQSLNLSPLDSNFAVVISDFENGPYDVSVIMLDGNRNPVGGSGEASLTFVMNVSAPMDADSMPGAPAASNLPPRLNAFRSLHLNVLRMALSYSRSIDTNM